MEENDLANITQAQEVQAPPASKSSPEPEPMERETLEPAQGHTIKDLDEISVVFMLDGEVVEHASINDIFSNPSDERSERYVTGKFG